MVFYGDKNNWWAAYALWVFSLFGHPDVRLLDGGRAKWIAEGRPLSTDDPEARSRPTTRWSTATTPRIRAFQDQVLAHLGQPLIDVRSPGEYTGELLHMPDYPQEGALRGGHIPGAASVPWARAAAEDGTLQVRAPSCEAIYQGEAGLSPDDDVIAYCRIGERSSHTWFVLQHLLGYRPGAQLRRLVDRVGQHRPGADHPQGQPVTRPPVTSQPASGAALIPGCRRSSTTSADVPAKDRLQLLLEFSQELPPLPGALRRAPGPDGAGARSARRRCSWPSRSSRTTTVHLYFDAPAEAPTTRGFAAILHAGLDGAGRRRGAGHPARVLQPARAGRPGQPAAAARHGRDAGPDQAPGEGAASLAVSCWALTCAQSR